MLGAITESTASLYAELRKPMSWWLLTRPHAGPQRPEWGQSIHCLSIGTGDQRTEGAFGNVSQEGGRELLV